MDSATRSFVRERAAFRCEYCQIPEAATPFIPFHIEHVIARQHIEDHGIENLALACDRCNAYKGPNLSSIDPVSNEVVPLFHPRRDTWEEHFAIDSGLIVGLTAIGRATVHLLQMNASRRVQLRTEWEMDDPL